MAGPKNLVLPHTARTRITQPSLAARWLCRVVAGHTIKTSARRSRVGREAGTSAGTQRSTRTKMRLVHSCLRACHSGSSAAAQRRVVTVPCETGELPARGQVVLVHMPDNPLDLVMQSTWCSGRWRYGCNGRG